ncbi:Peroxisome biogenesis protein 22, partial [Zea mays]
MASASAPVAGAVAGNDDELADLVRRLVDALARYADRLPFDLDRQKLRSLTTLAAISITLLFAWKMLRGPQEQPPRPRRRIAPSSSNTSTRSRPGALTTTDACSSADSRAHEAVNQLFQPVNLTLEQLVKHKLSGGRRFTCRLLGVILEETAPEELQNHVTVKPSVVEVLLEIAKICDVYLMECVLDDESEAKVYQISTAHFTAATGKNSIQCLQRSKPGTIFWRPRPEIEVKLHPAKCWQRLSENGGHHCFFFPSFVSSARVMELIFPVPCVKACAMYTLLCDMQCPHNLCREMTNVILAYLANQPVVLMYKYNQNSCKCQPAAIAIR